MWRIDSNGTHSRKLVPHNCEEEEEEEEEEVEGLIVTDNSTEY